jgi:3-hydroxyisobutyrate dehydrogenase
LPLRERADRVRPIIHYASRRQSMKVGFIGLGSMGAPMARNLVAAGLDVTVFDIDLARMASFEESGVRVAASSSALAEQSDVLLTSLPGPKQSGAAMPLLLATMKPGTLWIDLTTNDRALLRKLAGVAKEKQIDILEAPVTGAVDGACTGRLTLFVGGEDRVLQRAASIFAPLGRVIHCGAVGTGSVVKLVTNQIWFINAAAIGEAFALGVKGGVDPLTVWEALKQSAGDTWVCRHDVPSIFAGHYDPSFTLDLCCKDLGLLEELGRDFSTLLPMTRAAHQRFTAARNEYGGQAAELLVCKLIEEQAGISLQVPGRWPLHSEA